MPSPASDDPNDPEPRFAKTELIAAGALAEVWRGVTDSGKEAAIKILHSHLRKQPEVRQLFATEQQLALNLVPHPYLVRGDFADDTARLPYLVMSLAPGHDLRKLLVGKRLPLRTAVALVAKAAEVAHHLHTLGWVHGDLVPSNFVVDLATEGLVVCDLGVAREINTGGPMRGTHAYMAPEQVRGETWTPATDVFALGVCLWELVTGERLFHRGPTFLTMAAVIEHTPSPLPSPVLEQIADKALQKEPSWRMQSARELADALVVAMSNI